MTKGILRGLFGKSEDEKKNRSKMNGRILELEKRVGIIEDNLALTEKRLKNLEATIERIKDSNDMAMGSNDSDIILQEKVASITSEKCTTENHSLKQLYMDAPTNDGIFTSTSENEEIGKSLYVLTTKDYVNGSFILLDSPDVIATAMISISQLIKPVCKIIGNVNAYPKHIVTKEEGIAVNEDGVWKVTKKAVVRFEN